MSVADANGQRLYYEIHGQGEPLLCVMGLGSDLSGWSLLIPELSQHHRTIVFDNRDVGRSSYATGDYEIADVASDAIALTDSLALERFHLMGMSLGGAIAQEVALAIPERVRTLTLCVTYAGAGRWARERARLEVQALVTKSDEQLIDEMMMLTLSEAAYENAEQIAFLKELVMSYPYRQRREGFIRQLQAGARHEARDRLSTLAVPTHVIGAEQDLLVPVWKSRELAEIIPDAKLSVITGAAHALNVERAAELSALVLEFIRGAGLGSGLHPSRLPA